jgi:mRNA interferase RelE/StbE
VSEWEVVWDPRAISNASRYLEDDRDGLAQVLDSIDLLAEDPRPEGSIPYGSDDLRRIHVGRYRVIIEIALQDRLVTVIHLGRTA